MKRAIFLAFVLGCLALDSFGAESAGKTTAAADFGFKRSFDPQWFPDDPRQWSHYAQSIFLTDWSKVEESAALATGQREKGKWKVLPYEAGDLKGNALSAYSATEPTPVRLRLQARGWHAVYIGLSTVSGGITKAQPSGVAARLGRDEAFRRIQNNMRLTSTRGDVVQELFLAVANLEASEVVEIKPLPNFAATVMYVRLVPIEDTERRAWQEDGRDLTRRNTVTTWDGHSWIWPFRPQTAQDLRSSFVPMDRTDFSQWWWGGMGADLVGYPSKVGTVPGSTTKDFPTAAHGEFVHALAKLFANGVNPLLVARGAAREQGRSFHIFIRPQAWGASLPFEETFDSKFFQDHPEWRCVDREGRHTLLMSWSVPEVRQHVLAVIREAVEMSDPDGVGFFFNRGMPLMLWEKAFSDQFQHDYGVDIMSVAAEDPRLYALRGKIMTGFLTDLRVMLDEIGKTKGHKRYAISATTLTTEQANTRFGLDVATWVQRGLVDQLGVIVANHTAEGNVQYPPPDMSYYRKVVAGSAVTVNPFVVAWSTKLWTNGNPADMCRLITQWYAEGADGIGIWDPEQGRTGYGDDVYQGQPLDVLAYLGHRELIAYWAKQGVPLPNTRLVTRLGDNEYSPWYPNVGY